MHAGERLAYYIHAFRTLLAHAESAAWRAGAERRRDVTATALTESGRLRQEGSL
jgi:hypothetical protein